MLKKRTKSPIHVLIQFCKRLVVWFNSTISFDKTLNLQFGYPRAELRIWT